MGREIGRHKDVAKGFAEGATAVPHPSTRARLEELYRKWAPTLEDAAESEILFYKGVAEDLLGLFPDDPDRAREALRAAMDAPGEDGQALRRKLTGLLEKMLESGFAVQGKYPMQRHEKKRAPRKRKPDAPDYLAGIPPGEGVEEPKPKRRGKKPPPAPEEPK